MKDAKMLGFLLLLLVAFCNVLIYHGMRTRRPDVSCSVVMMGIPSSHRLLVDPRSLPDDRLRTRSDEYIRWIEHDPRLDVMPGTTL